ncbi:GGDEF domain protein, partial [Vibrio parahaemolyticus V-223/04]
TLRMKFCVKLQEHANTPVNKIKIGLPFTANALNTR